MVFNVIFAQSRMLNIHSLLIISLAVRDIIFKYVHSHLKKGYKLNEYGLIPKGDADADPSISESIHTESDLYEALGLKMIHPCLRENSGEIEAASENKLPKLVTLENLRGTFHNHTTASDGKNTLEEMANAAKDLGMQYLGISDHSKSSVPS